MTNKDQQQLGKTLWDIADNLRGAMNADDFRDYMLSFLFLRYLSYNYEEASKKELGKDYPKGEEKKVLIYDEEVKKEIEVTFEISPLTIWYRNNTNRSEKKYILLLNQNICGAIFQSLLELKTKIF